MKTLAIVVPCYNEEEMLPYTKDKLLEVLDDLTAKRKIKEESYVLFVDDGSRDRTWGLISEYHNENNRIKGLKLSRNKGHQNALLAGLEYAREHADVSISIDADLQDDVSAIEKMVDRYNDGCEIVYGVRSDRKSDTFFKRFTAQAFYRFMNRLGARTIYNHADYRLMGRKALEALFQYREVNVFLRGIVPNIGYKTDVVYYERSKRLKGESKYPLKKMLSFAFEGITSFSIRPLTMIFKFGIFLSFVSVLAILVVLILHLLDYINVNINVYIELTICFLLSLNLIALGVVGQYVGKNYIETKARPRYFVEKILD